MKTILKILLALAILFAAMIGYSRLQANWEQQERLVRADRVSDERISRLAAEVACRNQFSEKSLRQAIQSERESEARWQAAKERGSLPGNNTVPSSTSVNTTHSR